jgi:hypothetical protein
MVNQLSNDKIVRTKTLRKITIITVCCRWFVSIQQLQIAVSYDLKSNKKIENEINHDLGQITNWKSSTFAVALSAVTNDTKI